MGVERPVFGTVVITGASAGVGRATARAFAAAGARLGLLGRSATGLDAAVCEVRQRGVEAIGISCDVADAAAVVRAADRIEAALGPIDVWVNNAMVSTFAEFDALTPEEFRRVTDVTYLGYVWGTRAALRSMLPRDQGVVVQVGSALAYRSIPLQSAYCGAKHAMKGFTQSVRTELMHRHSGVRVAMVQLPAINTPQFAWVLSRLPRRARPVPPVYQPEVAARAVVWTAAHPRREVWVGGSTVATLLVNKVAAGVLDRYLALVGYARQQTDEPEPPARPSNLWEPVEAHRAHGPFDTKAWPASRQLDAALAIGSLLRRRRVGR